MSETDNRLEGQAKPFTFEVRLKGFEESVKLRYDSYKHLTTLSTGSIIIIATFLEKVFLNPKWKALVGAAFALFLLSIILSFVLMNACSQYLLELEVSQEEDRLSNIFVAMCFGSFVGGLIVMTIFAIRNLW